MAAIAKFEAKPAAYAEDAAPKPAAAPAPEGAIWTCPMHPEIQRAGPGSCPICGMALEAVNADTRIGGPSEEYRDMRRRFWIRLLLALPVVALEMGGHLTTASTSYVGRQTNNWIADAARDPRRAMGWLALLRARLASRSATSLNMFTPHSDGDGRCLGLQHDGGDSPANLPGSLRAADGSVAALFRGRQPSVTVLVLLGQVLELRAREQTSGAIRALP